MFFNNGKQIFKVHSKILFQPECRFCKKTFRQVYSLKIHMNIHTGRRPYVCEICGYSCHSPQVRFIALKPELDFMNWYFHASSDSLIFLI